MCLTDLLHIELHNHNLKQFDEAWKEMLLSFDNNMGGELLEKLHERQLKKVNAREERVVAVSLGYSFQRGTEERQKTASHRQSHSRMLTIKSINLPEGALSR